MLFLQNYLLIWSSSSHHLSRGVLNGQTYCMYSVKIIWSTFKIIYYFYFLILLFWLCGIIHSAQVAPFQLEKFNFKKKKPRIYNNSTRMLIWFCPRLYVQKNRYYIYFAFANNFYVCELYACYVYTFTIDILYFI